MLEPTCHKGLCLACGPAPVWYRRSTLPRDWFYIVVADPLTLCATTMDDRKLLALAKKNAAAALKKPAVTPKYDSTLQPEDAEDVARLKKFMNEMKKRDF